MWQEIITYLVLVIVAFLIGRRIYQMIKHPGRASECSSCTADCKLKGLKNPEKKEKEKICNQK